MAQQQQANYREKIWLQRKQPSHAIPYPSKDDRQSKQIIFSSHSF
jgi:hypothetical protein